MSELLCCDNCGGKTAPDPVQGWYRLEYIGQIAIYSDTPGTLHFCTLSCAATWTLAEVGRRNELMKVGPR